MTQFSLGHPHAGPCRGGHIPTQPPDTASPPQAQKPGWDVTWGLSAVLWYTMVVAVMHESNHFGIFSCVFILAPNYTKPASQPRCLRDPAARLRGWACRRIMAICGEAIILHWQTQIINYRHWNHCIIPIVLMVLPHCLTEIQKFTEKTGIKGGKTCTLSLKI